MWAISWCGRVRTWAGTSSQESNGRSSPARMKRLLDRGWTHHRPVAVRLWASGAQNSTRSNEVELCDAANHRTRFGQKSQDSYSVARPWSGITVSGVPHLLSSYGRVMVRLRARLPIWLGLDSELEALVIADFGIYAAYVSLSLFSRLMK